MTVAQTGCSDSCGIFFSGDIQKPSGHNSEWGAPEDPAWAGMLDQGTSSGLSILTHPVIQCVIYIWHSDYMINYVNVLSWKWHAEYVPGRNIWKSAYNSIFPFSEELQHFKSHFNLIQEFHCGLSTCLHQICVNQFGEGNIILLQFLPQQKYHKTISKLRSKYLNLHRFEKPDVKENENLVTNQITSDLSASETVQIDRQQILGQDNIVDLLSNSRKGSAEIHFPTSRFDF